MLNNQTIDKLLSMKLNGMVKALQGQEDIADVQKLAFHDRLALLIDAEYSDRESQKLGRRLKTAKLKQSAVMEDIDFSHPRGLERGLISQLSTGQWVREGLNVLITGPTGVGKSYLACALAHKVCKLGFSPAYYRAPRFFQDLMVARMDGSYNKFLNKLLKFDLLVLDDFALIPVTEENSRDLLEVTDDRCGHRSLLISSQVPVEDWHRTFENPTLADAILDRIIHSAYKIELTGKTLRGKRKKKDSKGEQ
ncbi:MAG: IS21-like element helper ATPase IstB [Cyanobacteria bacterium HKST-UBA02]|nr:IS21-like element helper ATPase IstB [Cyanobacteria bacterium HKST-UBA02]